MPTYKIDQFVQALKETHGMIYHAADRVGCSAHTIISWIKKNQILRDIVESESEKVTDTAELKLYQAIIRGEPWAISYRLTRKGKKRGYGDSVQVEVSILRDEAKKLAEQTGLSEEDIIAEAELLLGVKLG